MRKRYVDLLRLIALVYMYYQHTVLGLLQPSELTGAATYFYEIVPFCPALFLFLAGFSARLSMQKKTDMKTAGFGLMRRGLILIGLSAVLFFFEHGLQFPDFPFSTGILNSIGWFLILTGAIIMLPKWKTVFCALTALLTAAYIALDLTGFKLFPLTDGYEPMLPTILFGFYGLVAGLAVEKLEDSKVATCVFNWSLIAAGLGVHIVDSFRFGFLRVFFPRHGRVSVERTFDGSLNPIGGLVDPQTGSYKAVVWNFNMESFVAALAATILLFGLARVFEKPIQKLPSGCALPGEFALGNYIFHLIAIAVTVAICGFNSLTLWQTLAVFIGLVAVSYIGTAVWKAIRTNKISSTNL